MNVPDHQTLTETLSVTSRAIRYRKIKKVFTSEILVLLQPKKITLHTIRQFLGYMKIYFAFL